MPRACGESFVPRTRQRRTSRTCGGWATAYSDCIHRRRVVGAADLKRVSHRRAPLVEAEERQARLEPLDRDPRTTGPGPALTRQLEHELAHRHAPRRDDGLAGRLVAEPLGDARRRDVALDHARTCTLGAEARKGELEDGCAHLGAVATTLKLLAEP